MIKTKKNIALLIAVLMLMSNFMGLLGNISLAIQSNVTVEFSVENDGSAHLSENGKSLNYECDDHSSYDFQLGQFINDEFVPIELTEQGNSQDGHKYIATGISSNQNLKIYCPNYNGGVIEVFYGGQAINMFPEDPDNQQYFYSFQLEQIEDVNYYQFRIQEKHDSGNGNVQDVSNVDFTVDFGEASWVVGDTTVNATINGNPITNNPVNLKGNTEITLTNYDPTTMDVHITEQGVDNPFGTTLRVDQNGVTRIMDHNADNLPGGPFIFAVEEHHDEEYHDENQDMSEAIYRVTFNSTYNVNDEQVTVALRGENNSLVNVNGQTEVRGNQDIVLNGFDPETMEVIIRVVEEGLEPERWYSDKLNVSENGVTHIIDAKRGPMPNDKDLEFFVGSRTSDGPEWNLPEPNTFANVTVTSNEDHRGSYIDARININGFGIDLGEPGGQEENVPEIVQVDHFDYAWDEEHDNNNVNIRFSALFNKKYVGKVVVNGEEFVIYDEHNNPEDNLIDYNNRTDWLNHYGYQEVGFDVLVNKADTYNIVVDLEDMEGYNQYIGNFLWTDNQDEEFRKDGQGNIIYGEDGLPEINDEFIGHSKLELLEVTYEMDWNCDGDYKDENEVITVAGEDIFNDPHIEYDPYGRDGHIRSLVVPEGAECLMKITPKYGYQVTSFGVNGNDVLTGDGISEFKFVIMKGNFHLSAKVRPVDDVVSSTTEKVKSGSIEIGQDEIDSGTVVLLVDDVNLTDEKQEEFANTARSYAEEGYTVSSYLDISLDQVFYKGTADNVWANEIHELKDDATIELELDEDLSDKSIIVLHNINDGDEYEIIEIEGYNPDTNTVTFKTNSFSNYAIAVKDNTLESEDPENSPADLEEPTGTTKTPTETTKNPKTGDNIMFFVTMFVTSVVGIAVARKKRK